MATSQGLPPYEFIQGTQKPILYIGGYKLLFNRIRENADGDKTAYFYCFNKVKHGSSCTASAKAMVCQEEDGTKKFMLSAYNAAHSADCVPNSSQLTVKAVRETIKTKILQNPTMRPSVVYSREVDRVRDTLGEGFKEEFDQLMPTQAQMNPSIYGWKRSVVPANPEAPENVDTECPFFLTDKGENICKASVYVDGDPRRRLILLTTDRVMEAGLRFAERGVMDATFDVRIF